MTSTPRFTRRTDAAGQPTGRRFSLEWGDQSRPRELRLWRAGDDAHVAGLQVVWLTEDGELHASPVVGPAPRTPVGLAPPDDVDALDADEVVNGLAGQVHDGRVVALALVSQRDVGPLRGWPREDAADFDRVLAAPVPGLVGFDPTAVDGGTSTADPVTGDGRGTDARVVSGRVEQVLDEVVDEVEDRLEVVIDLTSETARRLSEVARRGLGRFRARMGETLDDRDGLRQLLEGPPAARRDDDTVIELEAAVEEEPSEQWTDEDLAEEEARERGEQVDRASPSTIGTEDDRAWTLVDLPDTALVTGLHGTFDHAGITSIGLRCSVDGLGPCGFTTGPGGRIVPAADVGVPPTHDQGRLPHTPGELDTARFDHVGAPTPHHERPNPNFTHAEVRRVDLWDDELRVFGQTPEGDPTVVPYTFVDATFDEELGRRADRYVGGEDGDEAIRVLPDWLDAPPLLELDDGPWTAPRRPAPAGQDAPTWDNAFTLDRRVDYLTWAFNGIDLRRVSPFNLQEPSGAVRQPVFRSPVPGSDDFHVSLDGRGALVPNGWTFVGDVTGTTKGRRTSSFSEEESRRSWATSLGISASADVHTPGGFGAKVAYTNNQKAHAQVSAGSSGKVATTITETVELSHALVLDPATVQLDDGFRHAVRVLAAAPSDAATNAFLDRFGTHVARAITYGSKTWEQRHETEASFKHALTTGRASSDKVSAEVNTPYGGGSASRETSSEQESSTSASAGHGSEVSSSGTVGSATEPVPIMLDVQDISHLLSPVLFDDPLVYDALRSRVRETLYERAGDLSFDGTSTSPQPLAVDNGLRRLVAFSDPTDLTVFYAREVGGRLFEIDAASASRYGIPDGFQEARGNRRRGELPRSTGEGFAVGTRRDGATQSWWLRGNRRYLLAEIDADVVHGERNEFDAPDPSALPAVAPDPFTFEGKVLTSRTDGGRIWHVRHGRRDLVPTEDVLDVLGGWEVVLPVYERHLHRLPLSYDNATVEGHMIRVASVLDEAWLLSGGRRHRVAELAVQARGGWQQVAVVAQDVFDRFPASEERIA